MDCSSSDQFESHYPNLFTRIQSLPPLPQFLDKLLKLIQNDEVSMADLEDVIHHDEALSAKILCMANSSYYGGRGKVLTLSRAMMALGYHEVKLICLCGVLMGHFHALGENSQRAVLWKHALATAKLAGRMAQIRPWIDRETAYGLGLLHDLGRLAMLVYFQDDYGLIQQTAHREKISFWEAELQHGLIHTQVGHWLAVRWGMPEVYRRVMGSHHEAQGEGRDFEPVVAMIQLANVLAHSKEHPDRTEDSFVSNYCKKLCISPEEWQEYRSSATAILDEAEHLWNTLI